VGAELIHADGQTDRQTDMTKLGDDFCDNANAAKNALTLSCVTEIPTCACVFICMYIYINNS
jgi:hypothetical protein